MCGGHWEDLSLTDDVLHERGERAETRVHAIQKAAENHDSRRSRHHAVLRRHGHRGPVAQA